LTKQTKTVAYEAPALRVLGTARELTMGPVAGPNPDATLLLHTSR
jgi:hypothetical protein